MLLSTLTYFINYLIITKFYYRVVTNSPSINIYTSGYISNF